MYKCLFFGYKKSDWRKILTSSSPKIDKLIHSNYLLHQ